MMKKGNIKMDGNNNSSQTENEFSPPSKPSRRVRFADTVGLELVSIFLIDLINNYYLASKVTNYFHHEPITNKPYKPPASKPLTATTNTTSTATTITNNNSIRTTTTTTNSNNSSNHSINHHNNYQQKYNYNSQSNHYNNNSQTKQLAQQPPSYRCEFTQPISLISFKERVKINRVHLETCQVNAVGQDNVSVACTIRVFNQSYEKSVLVRYTTDEWRTHKDCPASYKPGSCDGWSDKFTSAFSVSIQPGQRILFCISYSIGGDHIYWDNNGGLNYTIKRV